MLGNVDRLRILSLLLVLVFLNASYSYAKCAKQTREEYIDRTPIILKGKVENLKKNSIKGFRSPILQFEINVLMVFKGNVDRDRLNVRYELVHSKPAIRSFKEGQIFIFGISDIEGSKANIHKSTCPPILKDEDFQNRSKSAHIIKDKKLAIEIAEVYLRSIYGDRVLKQRPFKAKRSGDMWQIEGTLNCPKGIRRWGDL